MPPIRSLAVALSLALAGCYSSSTRSDAELAELGHARLEVSLLRPLARPGHVTSAGSIALTLPMADHGDVIVIDGCPFEDETPTVCELLDGTVERDAGEVLFDHEPAGRRCVHGDGWWTDGTGTERLLAEFRACAER